MTATNKEMFFEIGKGKFIPPEIRYYSSGLTPQGDRLDTRRVALSAKVADFIAQAPPFLQDRLFYKTFCIEEGLMTKRTQIGPMGGISLDVPAIPFREVTLEELVGDIRWQNFMDRYQLPRNALVGSVGSVLGMIPREDTRYLNAWDITRFDRSMEVGAFRVALALLPNLTDEEARVLFNNLTTVKSINEKLAAADNPDSNP